MKFLKSSSRHVAFKLVTKRVELQNATDAMEVDVRGRVAAHSREPRRLGRWLYDSG